MTMSTRIAWTDETWNPIVGCSKCSPGCQNCYAEKMAFRQTAMHAGSPYEGVVKHPFPERQGGWNGRTAFVPSQLEKPLQWRNPRRIFPCSMGDLFHESVPRDWQWRVFEVIQKTERHTYQLLTKRPGVMRDVMIEFYGMANPRTVMPNVWAGVTVCTQAEADANIQVLLETPAAVRFVSIEPMLEYIDMSADSANAALCCPYCVPGIDWVICGGESGPCARPIDPQWVRSLRDQCQSAGVPFFLKQWGDNPLPSAFEEPHGLICARMDAKRGGDLLDGRQWTQYPEVVR